jgi:hypothetical protein
MAPGLTCRLTELLLMAVQAVQHGLAGATWALGASGTYVKTENTNAVKLAKQLSGRHKPPYLQLPAGF